MSISPSTILLSSPNQLNRNSHFLHTSSALSQNSAPRNYNPNLSFPLSFNNSRRRISLTAISGSTGIDSSVVGEEITNLLERVQVFDLNGNSILISDLWKDRKAVVAFARHFGCVLCRKRADYLAAKKDRMDASGVALVLIGPGSVDQAKAFSEQTRFKGVQIGLKMLLPNTHIILGSILGQNDNAERAAYVRGEAMSFSIKVYADPSYSSYKALRFVSGVSTTFTPGAGLKIIEAYMEGYRQDWGLSFEKDTRTRGGWQQGGIIVAGPGISNISYIHKDKEAGDDPDIEDILKACCS